MIIKKIIPLLNREHYEKTQLQKRVNELEKLVGARYSFESIIRKIKTGHYSEGQLNWGEI